MFASYWYWFMAAAGLLIFEILVPGIFLIWLGLGAALVGLFLLALPDADFAWQLLALAVSITLSVLTGLKWQRRIVRQQPQHINQGLEGFIGRSARVSQTFHQGQGRISLEDSSYPALCNTSAPLQVGDRVNVLAVEDHQLVVATAQSDGQHTDTMTQAS